MKGLLLALLITAASAAVAQQESRGIDFALASEVVRGLTSEQTSQQILQSTNLLANYRELAVQQELAVEAVRRGLTERVDVQRALEQYRRQILVAALRQEIARKAKAPSDDQIAEAFKAIKPAPQLAPGYKLDVWLIPAADTQTMALAKSMSVGKAVADETVERIKAPMIVSQKSEAWITANQMTTNIWSGLAALQLGEVKLFPDGSNTMVVRRGEYRAARPITLDEARSQLVNELTAREGAALWQQFIDEKAKELGLP